jgi:hypothetical protein
MDFGNNVDVSNSISKTLFDVNAANRPKTSDAWDMFNIKRVLGLNNGNDVSRSDPRQLMSSGASIDEFMARGYTVSHLLECNIELKEWFEKGYTLGDLAKMGINWHQFLRMGYRRDMIRKIPVAFLVDVLRVDVSHLLGIGLTIETLLDARFKCDELLSLKCTAHTLYNMNMTTEQRKRFGFTEREWSILCLSTTQK